MSLCSDNLLLITTIDPHDMVYITWDALQSSCHGPDRYNATMKESYEDSLKLFVSLQIHHGFKHELIRNKTCWYIIDSILNYFLLYCLPGASVTILATTHWVLQTLEKWWKTSSRTWRRVDSAWEENLNILDWNGLEQSGLCLWSQTTCCCSS